MLLQPIPADWKIPADVPADTGVRVTLKNLKTDYTLTATVEEDAWCLPGRARTCTSSRCRCVTRLNMHWKQYMWVDGDCKVWVPTAAKRHDDSAQWVIKKDAF